MLSSKGFDLIGVSLTGCALSDAATTTGGVKESFLENRAMPSSKRLFALSAMLRACWLLSLPNAFSSTPVVVALLAVLPTLAAMALRMLSLVFAINRLARC